jgi:Holliday junction resolvase RusA-like endonuclease
MTTEAPHYVITGRLPSHKNNYRPKLLLKGIKTSVELAEAVEKEVKKGKWTFEGAVRQVVTPIITHGKEFRRWRIDAQRQMRAQLRKNHRQFKGQVHVKLHYYPPDRRKIDLDSVFTGIFDILQDLNEKRNIGGMKKRVQIYQGVFSDDKYVANVDGSRIMAPDKDNPRVEIWVYPYIPSACEFR